jgi:hypothetical protein
VRDITPGQVPDENRRGHGLITARAAALVTATLVACLLAGPALSSAAGRRANAHPQRLVLSPRNGQRVRSNQVRIVLRSGDESGQLGARLNGVRDGSAFGPTRHGVRTMEASISEGIRRGNNVLRVTVREPGGKTRRATVRFAVRTSGPLVGAGTSHRVVVGQLTLLAGRIMARRTRRALPYHRWRLISGPHGFTAKGSRGAATSRPATLSHPGDLAAGFRPEAPGQYTLRLTSGRGRSARSDSVTLSAVPANPLVSVDTMVHNEAGDPGIRVGDTTYVAPPAGGKPSALVQVLVLDRQTLGYVSNTTYTDTDQLAGALNGLDDSKLVIAVLQKPGAVGNEPLKGQSLLRALAPIGFPILAKVSKKPLGGGSVSAIGVPKTNPGDANVRVDPENGEMNGYLTPDQHLEYGFISPEQIPFDFSKVHAPDRPDDVGFNVRVSDPHTTTANQTRFFGTNSRNSTRDQQSAEVNAMADFLNQVPNGDLVEIQTVSDRAAGEDSYRRPIGFVDRDPMVKLAVAVARVGGTRNGFNRTAVADGPASGAPVYTLEGWAGAGEGNGAEAALGVGGTGDRPDLSGTLRRNREYEFRPVQASTSGPVPDALESLTLDPPGKEPWPLDGDPGARQALSYLGTIAPSLGCNPRSAYWTQDLTEADTTAIADRIKAAVFPGRTQTDPCTGHAVAFTKEQFLDARGELVKELGWVGNVRSYLTKLSSPFTDGGLKSWAYAQTIADKVYTDARRPSNDTALRWTRFTEIILQLLGPFTKGVTAEMANMMEFGVWVAGASQDGTPGGDNPRFKADELGAQLVDQAQQAAATFSSLGNIIVSDYAKLSVVGANGGCNPNTASAPGTPCPPEFAFTDADRVAASADFYRGVQRIAYEKLVPLGFHVFELNPFPDGSQVAQQPPNVAAYMCGLYHPWNTAPPWPQLGSTALLQKLDSFGRLNNEWEVLVLAVPPAVSDQHGTPPPETLLHRMYDPVSGSNDPEAGGLGISPTQLMGTAPLYGWEHGGPGHDSCRWVL